MGNEGEPLEASLELRSGEKQADEDADRMTRRMLLELRESGVAAQLVQDQHIAEGAKGAEMVEAGKLLLTLAPAVLPHLVSILHDWLGRNSQRSIKLKTPNGFEFEATGAMSLNEISDFVTTLGGGSKAVS